MRLHALLAPIVLLAAVSAQQVQLDPTHAFFWSVPAEPADTVPGIVADTSAGPITAETYRRYPGQGPGTPQLEDLAFDFVLAHECETNGVARSAPTLAPAMAARRMLESGRRQEVDPDGRLRARFATEALRQLRVDALVGASRQVDEYTLRALFDHRFGVDGVRVRVRHILVKSAPSDQPAALERARSLRDRLKNGERFEDLLAKSDDRTTRRLLRDPERAAEAGILAGYNYQRYGEGFAAAVRRLDVGAVSGPVASSLGFHLIQVVDRQVTTFDEARERLQQELGGGRASPTELDALRRALFQKYGFRPRVAADPVAVSPGDWPHYRGNPQLHGVAPGRIGSAPELAWTFETGGEILSSPVIVDGTVYVGSTDNSVYAIDLASGAKRWSYATGDMVEAPPLVLDGRVYVGSSDFFLYALDAASGELVWKFETMDRILGSANWFRAADGGNRIVVGSYDARLYCLAASDGSKQWSYETDNFVHGAPAVANGEIVFGGCDAALHLVDTATGNSKAKIELGEGCQIAGSVALAGDKAFFGHYGNEFLCVDLESGETEWSYSSRQGFVSSAAIHSKYVVVGSRDKQLHCVLRADGTPQWTFKTRRKIDGSPVICGDKVVFGSGDGRLYLLRLEDGEQLWSYDIGRPVFSSPAVCHAMIVVGASDKRVYAFRSDPDEKK